MTIILFMRLYSVSHLTQFVMVEVSEVYKKKKKTYHCWDNEIDIIEAFNSTSRYLDDLLNIDNAYFDAMVNQIYPSELQLNKVMSYRGPVTRFTFDFFRWFCFF